MHKQLKDKKPDPDILQQAFNVNATPNDKEREMLAIASGYTYKQVRRHILTEHVSLRVSTYTDIGPFSSQVTTWVSETGAGGELSKRVADQSSCSFKITGKGSKVTPSTSRLLHARSPTSRLRENLEITSHHVLLPLFRKPRRRSTAKRRQTMFRVNMCQRYRQRKRVHQ